MTSRFFTLLAALWATCVVRADAPLPASVLNPQTAPEAWNIIRLATANVEKLLAENRLGEIPVQISLCSPALRALAQTGRTDEEKKKLTGQTLGAFREIGSLARAAMTGETGIARAAFTNLRLELDAFAREFDEKSVKAEIHNCPMHPDCVSPDPKTPCPKCGMDLIVRRIPYSFIYVAPGQPTITLSATTAMPLIAAQKAEVKVSLKRGDGSPVRPADLMVMHTQPIHLLIVDPTLDDYHHEHPIATDTPGEYVFSFTPRQNGSYRIFADIVPTATGVQEYPFADLPGAEKGGVVPPSADRFESTVAGLWFQLALDRKPPLPPRAGIIRTLTVTVTDDQRQPITQLMPVMNAFAHLVGFYDDGKTVVHLHPTGGDVLRTDVRGGPAMEFKFYPPRAGHLRLYCQVLYEGRMIFAPFDVNIAP